jgi:hypothetical protein
LTFYTQSLNNVSGIRIKAEEIYAIAPDEEGPLVLSA